MEVAAAAAAAASGGGRGTEDGGVAPGAAPDAAPGALARTKTAAELNEEMQASGAFTLSYATDAAIYWRGIAALTGKPTPLSELPVMASMTREHRNQPDSEAPFEVGNYGTITCSKVEWLFVADPDTGLGECEGLSEWPGVDRAKGSGTRQPYPPSHFRKPHWDSLDRRLAVVGEQSLSLPEFITLRLYTGPLYMKYNAVLRAHSGVPVLKRAYDRLCKGNNYTNTLHVLTAAIIKLGKTMQVRTRRDERALPGPLPFDQPASLAVNSTSSPPRPFAPCLPPPPHFFLLPFHRCSISSMHNAQVKTVYRAPGGALPPSFWYQQPEGVQGGLELAFMSTTTAKEEAMAYARRAPGMILFEIQQGFVARGASIAWLSQYPLEVGGCLAPPPVESPLAEAPSLPTDLLW